MSPLVLPGLMFLRCIWHLFGNSLPVLATIKETREFKPVKVAPARSPGEGRMFF